MTHDNHRAMRGLAQCPEADLMTVDRRGRTPLYIASLKGHVEVVRVLLDKLLNIDVDEGRDRDGATPFSIASEKGHFRDAIQ